MDYKAGTEELKNPVITTGAERPEAREKMDKLITAFNEAKENFQAEAQAKVIGIHESIREKLDKLPKADSSASEPVSLKYED
ncbi:unnamed protein product [Rhizoctonia solani]|uniref:Uncharacterized protein n=1 Tax=Rhizoctonia solani TaxID=456999 RepID=A0A8H3GE27_9AGAM|nr:unnamed protein product [Rhizoctonia solani]